MRARVDTDTDTAARKGGVIGGPPVTFGADEGLCEAHLAATRGSGHRTAGASGTEKQQQQQPRGISRQAPGRSHRRPRHGGKLKPPMCF